MNARRPTLRTFLMILWYGGWVIAGVALIQSATPWGIGIRHDSLSYLTAAQSLARAHCLCRIGGGEELKPLVHFGPLYPVLLWAVTLLSGNVLVSARWIAAVLYGVNVALWGGLVHVHTRRWWAGAIVSALLAVSPVMLQVHDAAMSEPLFLAILALALLALTGYLARGNRRDLWLSAVAVSLAVLTRYAAGSFIAIGIAGILLLRLAPWKQRLADAVRFGVGAALPVALWSARNLAAAGSATNRTLRWHPITIDDLRTFLRLVTAWFTPGMYSHWVEGAIFLGLLLAAGFFLWARRKTETGQGNPAAMLGLLLVGMAGLYPLFIAVSKSLFDDSIPIDDRLFSPTYMALISLAGVTAALAVGIRRWAWILMPAAILLLVGPFPHMVGRFRGKYESMRRDGVLFASRAWHESESMAWLESLPADALVYSNQGLIAQFLSARPVYLIPEGFDFVKSETRADFEDQLARMRSDLKQPDSFLLIFDPAQPMTPDDLKDVFKVGLHVVRTMDDGFVMASDDGSAP